MRRGGGASSVCDLSMCAAGQWRWARIHTAGDGPDSMRQDRYPSTFGFCLAVMRDELSWLPQLPVGCSGGRASYA